MSNALSPSVISQLFAQQSDDPFLILIELTHPSFANPIYLVNNTVDIVSNGQDYTAFPMKITFPVDDGESARQFKIVFDNVGLDLIVQMRSVTTNIGITLKMILASMPDEIQFEQDELVVTAVTYNATQIQATVALDNFLNVAMTSEQYGVSNFPGLFG